MNIFNDMSRELAEKNKEKIQNAQLAHIAELQKLGITEEEYKKIQKRKEKKSRIIGAIQGVLGLLLVVGIIAGWVLLFSSDAGIWIFAAIMIILAIIAIWLLSEFLFVPLMAKWNVAKIVKILVAIVVSITILAIIGIVIGNGPEVHTPIHERY